MPSSSIDQCNYICILLGELQFPGWSDHITKNMVYFYDVCLFCLCYSQNHLNLIAAPYSRSVYCISFVFPQDRAKFHFSPIWLCEYIYPTGGTHKTQTNCKWCFNTISRAFISWISTALGSWYSPSAERLQVQLLELVFSGHFMK